MKVLDLCCAAGHRFEGWFASEDAFAAEHGAGRIACPLCGDRAVQRLPSAPRLNLSRTRAQDAPAPGLGRDGAAGARGDAPAGRPAAPVPPAPTELQARWLAAVRELLASTEDVGDRFAEEARRIHYGEREERRIRGQATVEERVELLEEGIPVVALPLPEALGGPLQ